LKALILAGGFGTRLRPLSCTRPKSLFPILNKPLLQWTLERLAKNSITEAILAVNHQTEIAIRQHRIPKNGIHVKYSRDPPDKPLGTGGPIKKAEGLLEHVAPFFVLNGDIFADVDYAQILELHNKKKAVATLSLWRVEDPSRYGVAELAKDNRIRRFIEKPPRKSALSNLINAGAYVLSPEIFNYIPKGQKVSIEREVFTKLAEEGKLYGKVFDGLWTDIGKPEDYLQINKALLDSFGNQPANKTRSHGEIKNPVALDKGVSVGKGSVVGPYAVLGKSVTIGDNVRIEDSIILSGSTISDSAQIGGAIVGEGVFVGKGAKIKKHCVLGDHVKIGNNVTLAEGVSVCPAKEVSESVLTPKCIV
jgi:mannose-1-phosphate guanylyltransferase